MHVGNVNVTIVEWHAQIDLHVQSYERRITDFEYIIWHALALSESIWCHFRTFNQNFASHCQVVVIDSLNLR